MKIMIGVPRLIPIYQQYVSYYNNKTAQWKKQSGALIMSNN